jgi:hypothetical protein
VDAFWGRPQESPTPRKNEWAPPLTTPADAANALTVRERVLLFCAASGTDWGHAGITDENRHRHDRQGPDRARRPSARSRRPDWGYAVLRAMLHE